MVNKRSRTKKSKKYSKLRGGTRKQFNKNKNKNKNKKNTQIKSCPPNMTPQNVKNDLICVGRCPHSGGPIYYNPKLDKFVCKWHGSQFTLGGKVLTPPANSNLKVKKIRK